MTILEPKGSYGIAYPTSAAEYAAILALPGSWPYEGCYAQPQPVWPPNITNMTPVSGPAAGGTTVSLTGTGLTGTTGVTFGGLAATSVVVTDTLVTCATPAHAVGAVTVVVAHPAGALSNVNGYTYV